MLEKYIPELTRYFSNSHTRLLISLSVAISADYHLILCHLCNFYSASNISHVTFQLFKIRVGEETFPVSLAMISKHSGTKIGWWCEGFHCRSRTSTESATMEDHSRRVCVEGKVRTVDWSPDWETRQRKTERYWVILSCRAERVCIKCIECVLGEIPHSSIRRLRVCVGVCVSVEQRGRRRNVHGAGERNGWVHQTEERVRGVFLHLTHTHTITVILIMGIIRERYRKTRTETEKTTEMTESEGERQGKRERESRR